MKGIVFTTLAKMVEETFGIDEWNKILVSVNATDGGAYVSSEYYEDSELLAIVSVISKEKKIPIEDLIFAYGKYLLKTFYERYPEFFEPKTLGDFLKSIHSVIHVEVKKLHGDVYLPTVEYREGRDNKITLVYSSKRKLCKLAEGLIHGAAEHYGDKIDIGHKKCMHNGDSSCHLEISIS